VPSVCAIVLAAGRSSRMGAFKPLLPFGNSTVIEACLNHLTDAGVEKLVVVIGHRGDEIRESLRPRDISFAVNPEADAPMSTSIARGIEEMDDAAGCVLIMPADHPAISSSSIAQIIGRWHAGQTLVQPEHDGRGGHPVLIDLSYRQELLNLDPNVGLRGFFDNHRSEVHRLSVDSPFVARDMDTWEDYLALHQEAFGRLPPQA
jgi:molybdenum cofactor cytidylyltransferase